MLAKLIKTVSENANTLEAISYLWGELRGNIAIILPPLIPERILKGDYTKNVEDFAKRINDIGPIAFTGDLLAANIVTSVLRELYLIPTRRSIKYYFVQKVKEEEKEILERNNLILIAGPAVNEYTQRYMKEKELFFFSDENSVEEIKNLANEQDIEIARDKIYKIFSSLNDYSKCNHLFYNPFYSGSTKNITSPFDLPGLIYPERLIDFKQFDYGFSYKGENIWNPDYKVYIFAGLRAYGTQGAASSFCIADLACSIINFLKARGKNVDELNEILVISKITKKDQNPLISYFPKNTIQIIQPFQSVEAENPHDYDESLKLYTIARTFIKDKQIINRRSKKYRDLSHFFTLVFIIIILINFIFLMITQSQNRILYSSASLFFFTIFLVVLLIRRI